MADIEKINDEVAEEVSGGGANGPQWNWNGMTFYRIVRGDTLSEIAERFHTSMWTIQSMNSDLIKNVNVIKEGWEIRVL